MGITNSVILSKLREVLDHQLPVNWWYPFIDFLSSQAEFLKRKIYLLDKLQVKKNNYLYTQSFLWVLAASHLIFSTTHENNGDALDAQ